MNFAQLEMIIKDSGQPSFRLAQFKQAFSKGLFSWKDVKGWPAALIETCASTPFISWTSSSTKISSDGTVKCLLSLGDGQLIETVLIETKPGHLSICVSCEVGCIMNCTFCATGALGFKRRLTAEEIADQLLFWKMYLKQNRPDETVKSIVFMGMGEPFHNTDSVFEAIGWINNWYGIGMRRLSVSTCGIPDGIISLGDIYPQVNLAISLHAPLETLRKSLMPVAGAIPLEALVAAVKQYMNKTHRQVMFEYLLIDGVNDLDGHIDALADLMFRFPLQLVHVNLIRYNPTNPNQHATPVKRVREIKEWLIQQGVSATIRKSTGLDIDGACGQLIADSLH